MQKNILQIHDARYEPIADLSTWRAMPTPTINNLDPVFVFESSWAAGVWAE